MDLFSVQIVKLVWWLNVHFSVSKNVSKQVQSVFYWHQNIELVFRWLTPEFWSGIQKPFKLWAKLSSIQIIKRFEYWTQTSPVSRRIWYLVSGL